MHFIYTLESESLHKKHKKIPRAAEKRCFRDANRIDMRPTDSFKYSLQIGL